MEKRKWLTNFVVVIVVYFECYLGEQIRVMFD